MRPSLTRQLAEADSLPPDQLIVQKHVVQVDLRDLRGRERSGTLFLMVSNLSDNQRERLQDVLRVRRFVPVRIDDGDGKNHFEFVSRNHLLWIRLDLLTAFDELDLSAESSEESVSATLRLEFDDASTLEGVVRYLRPPAARRVGDFLESLPDPFPLRTADHLYLVRPHRIMSVVPVHEGMK